MDAVPYEPTLEEADVLMVAELVELDEPATILFRLPAPPEPGVALQVIAVFVIAVYSFAAGYCVATVLLSNVPRTIFFSVLGFFIFSAAAWCQLVGVFRPHDERAHFAGNVLIGFAAMSAAGLTGLPMIAAQPLRFSDVAGYGGLTIFLAIAGHMNLVWSRQLRSVGWKAPGGWTFSLRELLAIFTAIAVGCGGYMLCTRMVEEAEYYRQQRNEIWRQQRVMEAELRQQASLLPVPGNTAGTSE